MRQSGVWKTTGMLLVAKKHCCFYTTVSNKDRKCVKVCHMFKYSLGIQWHVPYRRPNLLSNLWNSTLLLLQPVGMFSCEHNMNVPSVQRIYFLVWIKETTQNFVLLKVLSLTAVLSIYCIHRSVFLKHNLTQICSII